MNNELNGRRLSVPRGRDPVEDLNLLADAIAQSPADHLVDENDRARISLELNSPLFNPPVLSNER